jgi:hypothetical protein
MRGRVKVGVIPTAFGNDSLGIPKLSVGVIQDGREGPAMAKVVEIKASHTAAELRRLAAVGKDAN